MTTVQACILLGPFVITDGEAAAEIVFLQHRVSHCYGTRLTQYDDFEQS